MERASSQTMMKALVAARLLMGDFDDWRAFGKERTTAGQIANRKAARSVSAQIGRSYRTLSSEVKKFIDENFPDCTFEKLADLCDRVQLGSGIYLSLRDFEEGFFPISKQVTDRVPLYAHVSVTLFGLRFEFPEHHFIKDLEAALDDLYETNVHIIRFRTQPKVDKKDRPEVARLVGRQKFLCRSIISTAFSLVEAFLSGLFFSAIQTGTVGAQVCDDTFLKFAESKESASLKDRIDRVAKTFLGLTAESEPFNSFLAVGKRYRDAIHHTTPFARHRQSLDEGQRLLALYEIDERIALQCAVSSLDTVLIIAEGVWQRCAAGAIPSDCRRLRDQSLSLSDALDSTAPED
jgi:hypothetical protein